MLATPNTQRRKPLAKETAMDPVQAQVDAFNARDVDAFLACYAPDVVIEGADGTVMMRGHEQMRASYSQLFAQSPDLHVEIAQRIGVGAFVINEELATGFVFAGFPTELHVAAMYRLDGEQIAQVRLLM
jgi:hypothetical protein